MVHEEAWEELKEAHERQHFPWPPDVPFERPEPSAVADLYWDAYLQLTRGRRIGFTAAPIDPVDVMRFAEAWGYSDEQRDTLLFVVQSLDRAFFRVQKEQQDHVKQAQRGLKATKVFHT